MAIDNKLKNLVLTALQRRKEYEDAKRAHRNAEIECNRTQRTAQQAAQGLFAEYRKKPEDPWTRLLDIDGKLYFLSVGTAGECCVEEVTLER